MAAEQRAHPSTSIDWLSVWRDVARQVAVHRSFGRGHLLTEDSVRMCAALALERAGVDLARLTVEVPLPELSGGKADLVVDQDSMRSIVELKYPRGSRSGISPDTMTMGEILRDFLRMAVVDAEDRWVVLVLGDKLYKYLDRRTDVRIAWQVGDSFTLAQEALEVLPKTAFDTIRMRAWRLPVVARCTVAEVIGDGLTLFAYRIEEPDRGPTSTKLTHRLKDGLRDAAGAALSPEGASRPARRQSARHEILEAIGRLSSRSGHEEFELIDVVNDMRRHGTTYAESTIRTMVTSHMCAQAQGPGIGSYDDLDRVGRARYRLRATPGRHGDHRG